MILERSFFEAGTKQVAKSLIGKILVSRMGGFKTSGRIVETEAYLAKRDAACHAAKHRTARTEVMFGPAGIAYVYPIHAKYCFNVVTEFEETGCAVLIRALEPLVGVSSMQERRGLTETRRLTTGPGCLCQAMGIDRSVNGEDLTIPDRIWIEQGESDLAVKRIKSSVRIGVTSAKSLRLRFYLTQNEFVSGPAALRR